MKERLLDYTTRFTACKTDISHAVQIFTAASVVKLGAKLDDVAAILMTMGQDGKKEQEAARVVQTHGSLENALNVRAHHLHV